MNTLSDVSAAEELCIVRAAHVGSTRWLLSLHTACRCLVTEILPSALYSEDLVLVNGTTAQEQKLDLIFTCAQHNDSHPREG